MPFSPGLSRTMSWDFDGYYTETFVDLGVNVQRWGEFYRVLKLREAHLKQTIRVLWYI